MVQGVGQREESPIYDTDIMQVLQEYQIDSLPHTKILSDSHPEVKRGRFLHCGQLERRTLLRVCS